MSKFFTKMGKLQKAIEVARANEFAAYQRYVDATKEPLAEVIAARKNSDRAFAAMKQFQANNMNHYRQIITTSDIAAIYDLDKPT